MKAKKPVSRFARTMRALLTISLIGIVLGLYSAYNARRDANLATGPESEAQKQFFIEAADRPDLTDFFKSLKHDQRVAMARNIGRYQAPSLAKLIGTCLADFDPDARAALTQSLSHEAQAYPGAVAEQLKLGGSFQQLGVSQALHKVGERAVPEVVKQLSVGDARNNAVAFLVSIGEPSIPDLERSMNDDDADVRKAAADALGKIGSKKAVPALLAKYGSATGDEKIAYLSALSSIADPSTEQLFEQNLNDESIPLTTRAIAGLGLGRIASDQAVRLLWKYADHPDKDFAAQILSALQLAGDQALKVPATDPSVRVQVAAKIASPLADSVIRAALPSIDAAMAAEGRPELVGAVASSIQALNPSSDGDRIDALIGTLGTTPQGRQVLSRLSSQPAYAGFVERRKRQRNL